MPDNSPKPSMAGKYFAAGQSALDDEDWREARRWLKLAVEADPDNVAYQRAYERAKAETKAVVDKQRKALAVAKEEETVPARPSAPRRRISLPVAGGATAGLALIAALMLSRPPKERLVNHAEVHGAVAPFTSLVVVPEGGWVGTIHEDWSELDEIAKRERCEEIASGLPDSGSGVMVIRTSDGTSLVCLHVSNFPPGPEDIPGVEPYESERRLAEEASAEEAPSAADGPAEDLQAPGTEPLRSGSGTDR